VGCVALPSLGETAGQGRPRPKVGDIFRAHGEAYRKSHALSEQQRKAMHSIEACRTPVLGGRVDVCEHCGHREVLYGSCRNRHCPTCQSLSQARWIEKRMERLLPTDYFHVVFTVPDELLNGLILKNRELFFDCLFTAGSQTLLELGADPKRLGAQLGVTCVLHTWTRDLRFHAHLHCIVTGGGLHRDGERWLSARQGYLFPVKVLSKLFRGKMIAALATANEAGELKRSGSELADPKSFARLKDKLYQSAWVAYCKKPFAGPEQVFRYLGRYTHRVGISNQRLLEASEQSVRFRTRGAASVTLSPEDFIRRFLLHILPDRFVKIRHYGLMAAGNATTKLETARRLLEAEHAQLSPAIVAAAAALLLTKGTPVAPEDWRARLKRLTGKDVTICPHCQGKIISVTFIRLLATKPPDDTS
jgi:Putative transposase/Transposase zinc-binding domain